MVSHEVDKVVYWTVLPVALLQSIIFAKIRPVINEKKGGTELSLVRHHGRGEELVDTASKHDLAVTRHNCLQVEVDLICPPSLEPKSSASHCSHLCIIRHYARDAGLGSRFAFQPERVYVLYSFVPRHEDGIAFELGQPSIEIIGRGDQ